MAKHFSPKVISGKSQLLAEGDVAKEMYFITQGCLRVYYVAEGVDLSAYFFTEGMFGGLYESFSRQQPSRMHLEALEETHVMAITYPALQLLFAKVPPLNAVIRKILEQRLFELHHVMTSHILDSPEQRYLHLLQHRPELITRVPQHQLATYLGITSVSLSRLRSRLAKRKH